MTQHLHGGAVDTAQLAFQLAILFFLIRSLTAFLLRRNADSPFGHALAFIF